MQPPFMYGLWYKLEFSELLRRKLGPLVLRGLSGEQPDWGSFRLKYNSLSQKCRFYGIFASSLKTREPRAAAPPSSIEGDCHASVTTGSQ